MHMLVWTALAAALAFAGTSSARAQDEPPTVTWSTAQCAARYAEASRVAIVCIVRLRLDWEREKETSVRALMRDYCDEFILKKGGNLAAYESCIEEETAERMSALRPELDAGLRICVKEFDHLEEGSQKFCGRSTTALYCAERNKVILACDCGAHVNTPCADPRSTVQVDLPKPLPPGPGSTVQGNLPKPSDPGSTVQVDLPKPLPPDPGSTVQGNIPKPSPKDPRSPRSTVQVNLENIGCQWIEDDAKRCVAACKNTECRNACAATRNAQMAICFPPAVVEPNSSPNGLSKGPTRKKPAAVRTSATSGKATSSNPAKKNNLDRFDLGPTFVSPDTSTPGGRTTARGVASSKTKTKATISSDAVSPAPLPNVSAPTGGFSLSAPPPKPK